MQAAQVEALGAGHARLEALHILHAMLLDAGGLAHLLVSNAGGDAELLVSSVHGEVKELTATVQSKSAALTSSQALGKRATEEKVLISTFIAPTSSFSKRILVNIFRKLV